MKDKNLYLKKPRTLGACNRNFSCGTSYQYVFHGHQIIFLLI